MCDVSLSMPEGIYQYIFTTALLLHPTHIYAGFYYGMKRCGIMGLALYATSLNYWRYPLIKSMRRKVDMIVAHSTIAYHLYLSLYATNKLQTMVPLFVGSSMYGCSLFFSKKMWHKTSAFCHWLLHVLVSVGATLTYRDYYLHGAAQ